MSIKKEVIFKVFRFNSSIDYLPYYQEYKLLVAQDEVMLDILNRIKWEFDGSFSYRRSCRHGICGSCGIKVNKKPVLSCKERVFDLIDIFGTELVVAPQSEKRAIKDLIIDKKDFWQKYNSVLPYVVADYDEAPQKENLISHAEYEVLEEADYCIQCGGCYYSCPVVEVNEEYAGPATLALAYRFSADVRDNATTERMNIVNELGSGIWDCVKCYSCAEACPKGVNPIGKITKLHQNTFLLDLAKNNVASRHAVGFKNSITQHGFLNEAGMVMYSEGILKTITHHTPTGLKMLMAGKLPMPWSMPKSKKLGEIKKLVKISSTAEF